MGRDDNENEEDTDKRKEETNSNNGVGKKRCLIYKKDMETHRIEIPFKDSIIGKNEESNETSDDPRNGGKMEVKSNQKNVLGGVAVVLLGNVIQLPPVNGRYIFEEPAWPDYKKSHVR